MTAEIDEEKNTVYYEIGYLIAPTITEEDAPSEGAKVRDIVEKQGFIVSVAEPEKRSLAYEITKRFGGKNHRFRTAYFGHLIFQAVPEDATAIREGIRKNDAIIRTLIIKRTKESLTAVPRRVTHTGEPRTKRMVEKAEPINEAELDKQIEKMVAE